MPGPESDGANPYAPPGHDGDDFVPGAVEVDPVGPLFSPTQMGVAAVFGSLIGGGLLLQANYRALREVRAANVVTAAAVLATAVLYAFWVAFRHMPFVLLGIHIVTVVTFCVMASNLQRDSYVDHVLAGGARRSSWWVLGAILASAAARAATSFCLGLLLGALHWRL